MGTYAALKPVKSFTTDVSFPDVHNNNNDAGDQTDCWKQASYKLLLSSQTHPSLLSAVYNFTPLPHMSTIN